MSSSRVDAEKRILLPNSKPGEVFEIQQEADGRYRLVRLEKPELPEQVSHSVCLKAMQEAPLRLMMSWGGLREKTRES